MLAHTADMLHICFSIFATPVAIGMYSWAAVITISRIISRLRAKVRLLKALLTPLLSRQRFCRPCRGTVSPICFTSKAVINSSAFSKRETRSDSFFSGSWIWVRMSSSSSIRDEVSSSSPKASSLKVAICSSMKPICSSRFRRGSDCCA